MNIYQGIAVSEGIAIGRIHLVKRAIHFSDPILFESAEEEWNRVLLAIEKTKEQFELIARQSRMYAGSESAEIFQAYQMILCDEEFTGLIEKKVKSECLGAGKAVTETGRFYSSMFESMDEAYMRERARDIQDIAGRILLNLGENKRYDFADDEPVILLSDYLTPGDLIDFRDKNICGIAATKGSLTSHAAILVRSMELPGIIKVPVKLHEALEGALAVLDAGSARLIISPSDTVLEEMRREAALLLGKTKELSYYIGRKSVLKNGKEIQVCANILDGRELEKAKKLGCDGIGLFRSEFLFMERSSLPDEEEQFCVYKNLAEKMKGSPVVIRVLDIGSDKKLSYISLKDEKNPALGLRGIRFLLLHTEIFKMQLRAIFRAARDTGIKILYPMITDCEEVRQIQRLVQETAAELEKEKIPYRIPAQGIMIETPIAVIISDALAEMVDFFSIGTNDLTQYALAADRENEMLSSLYDQRHEGILQMIQMTTAAAHRHNIPVCICGELASDLEMIPRIIDAGVDELSVSPGKILAVRKALAQMQKNP